MALFIPNLNLPKGCGDCLFTRIDDYGESLCSIEPRLLIDGYSYIRHPKCPLIEVNGGIDILKVAKLFVFDEPSEEIVDKINSIGNPNIYKLKGEDK